MAWMRLEVAYIDHPKFLPLSADAICLWHEGKSYCEKHLTDGLIPSAAIKTFRFYTKARMTELTRSIGKKPNGRDDYAPLWEIVSGFGFKMHDYLEHNDCREDALRRMAKAKGEKDRKRQNQQAYRDRKEQERLEAEQHRKVTEGVTGHGAVTSSVTEESQNPLRDRIEPTTTTTSSSASTPAPTPASDLFKRSKSESGRSPGLLTGSLPRDHRDHGNRCSPNFAWCVPSAVHEKLVNALAPKHAGDRAAAATDLEAWYRTVWSSLPEDFVMPDAFRFWQGRFDQAFASERPGKPNTSRSEPKSNVPDYETTKRKYLS